MKYMCNCITVDDIKKSKEFYVDILDQVVKYDFGENVAFENSFAIQLKSHFAKMIGVSKSNVKSKANNFEIVFETDKLDEVINKLNSSKYEVRFLGDVVEHSWGQRVIRFYDLSGNLIEVGEDMEFVIKRFLKNGLSIKDTATKTQYPLEFVKQCNELI